MIKVNIESLVVGIMPMPSVITLRPAEVRDDIPRDNVLPIWIGSMESSSIAASLGSNTHERPLTHKLMSDVITAMGGSVSRVVIDRVEGTTFFSTIYLRLANGMFTRIDARPSDAIALAVRSKAPLFVEE
ncbi:MAG: bifunctional nuclease family protein, partial [Coriobacteriales bacterium]|nr:bifunctional nuclease family protein [Coriobacteriales bacterium]